jgi:hypothetical protein
MQKLTNNILVVSVEIVEHRLYGLVFIVTLHLLHLSQLDIIDAFTNPFIPIHPMLRIEFDASQLHRQCFIVKGRISGEKIKIKWVNLESIIENDERQSHLKD